MGKITLLILLLNLGTLLSSLASDCANPPPSNCPPPPYSSTPKPPSPPPKPKYTPRPPKQQICPIDALKLGACVDALGGLVHIGIGNGNSTGAKGACCPLLKGLADSDAAICLCTTIKAKLADVVNLVVPVALEVLVGCGKNLSPEFQCPK